MKRRAPRTREQAFVLISQFETWTNKSEFFKRYKIPKATFYGLKRRWQKEYAEHKKAEQKQTEEYSKRVTDKIERPEQPAKLVDITESSEIAKLKRELREAGENYGRLQREYTDLERYCGVRLLRSELLVMELREEVQTLEKSKSGLSSVGGLVGAGLAGAALMAPSLAIWNALKGRRR